MVMQFAAVIACLAYTPLRPPILPAATTKYASTRAPLIAMSSLDGLSVAELRALLNERGVDTSDVKEKQELIERLSSSPRRLLEEKRETVEKTCRRLGCPGRGKGRSAVSHPSSAQAGGITASRGRAASADSTKPSNPR